MNTQSIVERVKSGVPNFALAEKVVKSKEFSTGGRILQVFSNADLRNGHDGLTTIAKLQGIDVARLRRGEYVIFINSSRDKLKLFATHNVVAYYKTRPGEVLDLRTISLIPRAFNGSGRIDYDSALKEAVEQALARRRRQKE